LLAAIAGFHCVKGWSVGQKPGQPSGFCGVISALTSRAVVLASTAMRWTHERRPWRASAPVAPVGSSTGPNASDVPAPDSKAMLFIGCFEYSYDSTALANPARSVRPFLPPATPSFSAGS
jgi:hypothetical protein